MKKIIYFIIYVLCVSCTSNINQVKHNTENQISLNYNQTETNNINAELNKEDLANWNSKGFFNKYKYSLLFMIVYGIIGRKLNSRMNDSIYDNRKTKTAYLYFIFSSLFGGHFIYLGKYWKYWLYTILLMTFLFINTFNIFNYYNNPNVLIYKMNEILISKIILSIIVVILIFDFFTLSIQVFKTNKSFRDSISPKISKERELTFLDIKKSVEKNNVLMLQKFNEWKK